MRSLAFALGMIVAVIAGSSFIIGGLLAGAQGFAGLLLAAAVPAAALTWAVALSILDTAEERSIPVDRNQGDPPPTENERGRSLH